MKGYEYISFRGREDKILYFSRHYSRFLSEMVLDVGCNEKFLKRHINGRYIGIDISGSPDVRFDLEDGIPLKSGSVNSVVALDILEHIGKIHGAIDEMFRVSSRYVLIGLPNVFEWTYRLKFLLGLGLSGKYALPIEKPPDRHRWVFRMAEAREFVIARGQLNGFTLIDEHVAYYRYNRIFPRLIMHAHKFIAPFWPGVFGYNYWAVLERRRQTKILKVSRNSDLRREQRTFRVSSG